MNRQCITSGCLEVERFYGALYCKKCRQRYTNRTNKIKTDPLQENPVEGKKIK